MGISVPLLYSISMDVAIYWPYRFQSSHLTLYNKGNKHISQMLNYCLKSLQIHQLKVTIYIITQCYYHIIIIARWHVLARVRMYTCKPKLFLLTGSLDLKWSLSPPKHAKCLEKCRWMDVCMTASVFRKTMCTQCVGEDVLFILVFVTMQIHRRYTNRDNITHWGSLLQKSSE